MPPGLMCLLKLPGPGTSYLWRQGMLGWPMSTLSRVEGDLLAKLGGTRRGGSGKRMESAR